MTDIERHFHIELLARADAAALAAGQMLLNRPANLQFDSKSTATDVVTEMDRASEKLVVEMLLDGRPDDGLLGEEGSDRAGTSGVRWVIDPIDGTVNYLYGLPGWAVCIGCEIDGVTVAGVVHIPTLGETYYAQVGEGAYRRNRDGSIDKLSVTSETELAMALVATGFGYASSRRSAQGKIVAQLLPQVRDIRRMGAGAVDICLVAAGRVDAYYERGMHPWDHCAAGLIAQEAGAIVEGLNGRVASGDLVLAANPTLFQKLHDLLAPLGVDHD